MTMFHFGNKHVRKLVHLIQEKWEVDTYDVIQDCFKLLLISAKSASKAIILIF